MANLQKPVKDLVCDACWNTLFSSHGWQAVLDSAQGQDKSARGFSYKTKWSTVKKYADTCNWCRLLRPRRQDDADVEVTVSANKDSDCTPAGEKMLAVIAKDDKGVAFEKEFYIYTSHGMCPV
jgi:hypothetical protein